MKKVKKMLCDYYFPLNKSTLRSRNNNSVGITVIAKASKERERERSFSCILHKPPFLPLPLPLFRDTTPIHNPTLHLWQKCGIAKYSTLHYGYVVARCSSRENDKKERGVTRINIHLQKR